MKKLIIIVCAIVIFFCLFTIAFHWYFNPSRIHRQSKEEAWKSLMAQLQDGNAAKYYLQASQALVYSTRDESILESYEKVWQDGVWREDAALESYLNRNEPALELVRKGMQQKFCSMPIDDPTSGFLYFSGFREIARLMCVKGALLVSREKYAEAGEVYSDLLHFSADVSDNGIILHSLVAIAMEELAYEGVESFLAQLKDGETCKKLLNEMSDIESGRAHLSKILESEFVYDRKLYEQWEKEFLYMRQPSDRSGFVEFFLDPVRRIGGYLMFRLFKAKYGKETENFSKYIIDLSEKSYSQILREDLKEKIPNNELAASFEVVPDFIFLTARQEAIHRANIIRVALHLHFLKSGAYPEKLDELAPLMPEEVLNDPFSASRFIYKKTGDGYLLYSIGGDMKDDDGIQAKPPFSKRTVGDYVFQTPQLSASGPA